MEFVVPGHGKLPLAWPRVLMPRSGNSSSNMTCSPWNANTPAAGVTASGPAAVWVLGLNECSGLDMVTESFVLCAGARRLDIPSSI